VNKSLFFVVELLFEQVKILEAVNSMIPNVTRFIHKKEIIGDFRDGFCVGPISLLFCDSDYYSIPRKFILYY
jgi:hypothetical protein